MKPAIPVMTYEPSQQALVERWLAHVRGLDGTEVRLFPGAEERRGSRSSDRYRSFRAVAEAMRGQAFVWLEPEAIPLQAGWAGQLSAAFQESGKEILLAAEQHPEQAHWGRIGIYGPNAHWLLPRELRADAWEPWMAAHLRPLLGHTALLQFSPGHRDEQGQWAPLRFPANAARLRRDAVLFHADRFQDLLADRHPAARFYHTGDLGDIIAALPVIRQLGGGELVIGNHQPLAPGWRPMEGNRFEAIRPLLSIQPYVLSVRFETGPAQVDYDLSGFRSVYSRRATLAHAQARWLGVGELNLAPWLEAEPSPETRGRIVVARSARYHHPYFPWRRFVRRYGERLVFVGLREEYEAFVRDHGGAGVVQHRPTQTLLEVASLILGSDLFVGNQSSPCWIAMGLGHPMIQETHPSIHDSIVIRENARFFMGAARSCFAEMGVPL